MIVLDTHIWIWWVNGEMNRLPPSILPLLEQEPHLGVSAMSCLEMALLVKKGRIEQRSSLSDWFERALDGAGVQLLPLTPGIVQRAVSLPEYHRDPADRIIIATAVELNARLISIDGIFHRYTEISEILISE